MWRAVLPILILGLCGAAPATQPEVSATAEVLLARIRAEAAEREATIDRWPSLGERKIEDVLALDYNGHTLTPRTTFTPMPRQRSMSVEGYPGSWSAWLRFNRAGAPTMFHLERMNTVAPGLPYQDTDLTATPGKIMLSYTRETIGNNAIVQLLDDRTGADPSGPRPDGEVRLFVQVSDTATERSLVDLQYFESDMPTLIAAHREVVNVYVRPMLRELGQERLLLPDLAVARQVMAVQVSVGAGVAEEVERLVAKLDSDDFKERRDATAALKKLGLAGTQVMSKIDRSKLTPEQHNRVDEVVDANHPISPQEAERLGNETAFLLDCLDLNDPAVTPLVLARLEAKGKEKVAFDPNATAAERAKAVDVLRAKLLPPMEGPVKG